MSTCTMGGGIDDFRGGLIVGSPGLIVAANFLARTQLNIRWYKFMLVFSVLPILAVMFITVPWVISTTLNGHHVCGPDFDEYLSYSGSFEHWFPLLHVAIEAFLILLFIRSFLKAPAIKTKVGVP